MNRRRWRRTGASSLLGALLLAAGGLAVIAPAPVEAATFGNDGLVAFVRGGPSHAADVWTMDPRTRTGNPKDVTAQVAGNHYQPTFSPEGGPHLAFVTRPAGGGPGDIYWIPAFGGPNVKQTQVTNNSEDDAYPSFAPGGGIIVYSESDWRSGRVADGRILASHLFGSPATQLTSSNCKGLTPCDNITPAWSPDNSWIVFASSRGLQVGSYRLWIMPSQGGEVSGAAKPVGPKSAPALGTNPQWAPDSKSIVYQASGGQLFKVVLVRAGDTTTGTPPTFGVPQLLTRGFVDSNPQWEPFQQPPDQGSILFERGKHTWVMNADGSNQRKLPNAPAVSQDPDMQPVCGAKFLGTPHDDTFKGTNGRDLMCYSDGSDTYFGNGGDDVMFGGPGPDIMNGGAGNDLIAGGGGNQPVSIGDVINGGDGNDFLTGSPGPDSIVGGPGVDRLIGLGGDDVLNARDGAAGDVVVGGDGKDTCLVDQGDRVSQCEIVKVAGPLGPSIRHS